MISEHKNEPAWMRQRRLKALEYFRARPLPHWGGKLDEIDFENMYYYIRPTEKQAKSWEDLPADIKNTWDRLGIPEAEKKYLAGVGAQYESEVVYHKLKEDLESQGVLFLDMDSGLREHEELAERRVVLDVTPLSNLRTGVVASLGEHPLPDLIAAGIPCTVSTDDPEMFDTDLTREYEAALSLGIDPKTLYEAGVGGALCSDETRARLREIGEAYDWSAVGAEATA
jgi:Fe-S cluster assembly protein SufB